MLGKINHVAIAVRSLKDSMKLYKLLDADIGPVQKLPDHGVNVQFVNFGETKIEMMEPINEKSNINNFTQKKGGVHHICFETTNLDNTIKELKSNNIRLLSPEPKIGAHGKRVVFIHPKDCDNILVELEES